MTVDLRQLAIERNETAAPRLRRRRHFVTRYLLPAFLLLGFAALAAWASWDLVFPPKTVAVVPVFATRAEVQREGTSLFKAAGWVEPRPTAIRVSALSPGVVEKLLVVEDQEVKAGEPVAELIKDDARLALDRARTDLKLRKAELDEAQATLVAATTRFEQPVHLQAPLGEAESALAQVETQLKNLPLETHRAEASLEFAKKNVDAKVGSKGAVGALTVSQAQSELRSAEALVAELHDRQQSLEREKAALVSRRDALGKQLELRADETRARDEAKARVEAASSRVEQEQVAVAEAELRFNRMTVRSPIAGRVYRLVGPPGTALSGGMVNSENYDGTTVITMYRPDMLQLRVDVRFEDIPHVTRGQTVMIENPALKEPLAGKVLFISSQANIQKNTLEVKVSLDAAPIVFRPEMLVNATFLASPETGAADTPRDEMRIYVPQQYVHRDDGNAYVWLADLSAGRARRTPIEAGAASGNGLVEVKSGLSMSSRIISAGTENLRDGEGIRVDQEQADAAPAAVPANAPPEHNMLERLPTGRTH